LHLNILQLEQASGRQGDFISTAEPCQSNV